MKRTEPAIRLLRRLLPLLCAAALSCRPEPEEPAALQSAVVAKSCNDTEVVSAGDFTVRFTAAGPWSASTGVPWCSLEPAAGPAGGCAVTATLAPNTGFVRRRADLVVRAEGFAESLLCTLVQRSGEEDPLAVRNAWILELMREGYLWNEPLAGASFDLSLPSDDFLASLLATVARTTDPQGRPVNRDDGRWADGTRLSWYSCLVPAGTGAEPAAAPPLRRELLDLGGQPVGYLLLGSFDPADDAALSDAFGSFRAAGIRELVVDLRWNAGGSLRSAALAATLVAGAPCAGRPVIRTSYNAARRAAGLRGDLYRIGCGEVPDGDGTYAPLAAALDRSPELERLYVLVSEQTAAASEALVAGLRGLGVEVRLVGGRTGGVNVGMEAYADGGAGSCELRFVSFRLEDGSGRSDYADGFAPDVAAAAPASPDDAASPGDEGFARVTEWIVSGERPAAAPAACAGTTLPAGWEDLSGSGTAPERLRSAVRPPEALILRRAAPDPGALRF